MKVIRVLILLFSFLLVAGCASSPDSLISGKWEQLDGSEQAVFTADGTVEMTRGMVSMAGTWKTSGDTLTIQFGGIAGLAGPTRVTFEVSESALKLTQMNGSSQTYRRIKPPVKP